MDDQLAQNVFRTRIDIREQMMREILPIIKGMQKGWDKTPERQQDSIISELASVCSMAIFDATRRIASKGFDFIPGELSNVSIKKDAKASIAVDRHSNGMHPMLDAIGTRVVVVLADPHDFIAQVNTFKADPEQPPLDIEWVDEDGVVHEGQKP